MSIRATLAVWDRSKVDGSVLLLLLALADFADDKGYCWPSVTTLSQRCRRSERQVQRLISEAAAEGELEAERIGGRTTSRYLLTPGRVPVLDVGDDTKMSPPGDPIPDPRGDTTEPRGDVTVSPGGDITVSPEPSIEPPRELAKLASQPRARDDTHDTLDQLPDETDSATIACRYLPDGGRWLADREYAAAWDDMDHRFGQQWVQAEITPAYASLLEQGRVRAWDLKRMVELRCAERTRAEERRRAAKEATRQEQLYARREQTPEEREHSELYRRAIEVWLAGGQKGRMPTDIDELRAWVNEREAVQ